MSTTEFSLPEEVTALIERLVKRSGGSKRVRMDVRRELTAHFQDALEGCSPEEIQGKVAKLIAEFGDRMFTERGKPPVIYGNAACRVPRKTTGPKSPARSRGVLASQDLVVVKAATS